MMKEQQRACTCSESCEGCRIKEMFKSTADIVLSTGIKGEILEWNPAAEQATGYTEAQARTFRLHELTVKEDQAVVESVLSRLRQLEQPLQAYWALAANDGRHIPAYWICSAITGPQKMTTGMVAIGHKPKIRADTEMVLQEPGQKAALSRMARNLAHEIQNPLAVSYSAVQFLMTGDTSPELRIKYMQQIREGIKQASLVIDNLLKFTAPPSHWRDSAADLVNVVKEAVTTVFDPRKTPGIDVKTHLCAHPIRISGSAGRLRQAVVNLLLNRCRALQEGDRLSLTLEQKNKWAVLELSDTGCAIPESIPADESDPVFTIAPPGKRTNLEILISHTIIKQHGGEIRIKTKKQRGMVYTVRLPTAESE